MAQRYLDRAQGQQARRDAFDNLVDAAVANLERAPSTWLWLALRPDQPLQRRLDASTANAIGDWWHSRSLLGGPLGTQLTATNGLVGPGFVSFTSYKFRDEDDDADPRDTYIELHANGSTFVALDLNVRTSEDNRAGHVGYFTLVDGMIPMVDVAARWALTCVGEQGVATVAVGLADTTQQRVPLQLVGAESGSDLRRLRGTRSLRGDLILARDDTVADLAACSEVQGRLALVHLCLSYVLQRFGRPEPEQITSDGRVAWQTWKRFPEVKRWAEGWDLPLVDGLGTSLRL